MRTTFHLIFFTCISGAVALAQEPVLVPPMTAAGPVFDRPVMATAGVMLQGNVAMEGMRQLTVQYVGAEVGIPGQMVKGAPYSAQAVTQTTQTLADGNRIRHSSSSQVYRDSEGRTRREPALATIGLAPEADLPQLVFINDPVAGCNYVLNLKEKTAQKSGLMPPDPHLAELKSELASLPPGDKPRANVAFVTGGARIADGPGPVETFTYRVASGDAPAARTEPLGRQTFEGVAADGTRTTFTIEAGKIGNDRPIEIVSERWYSPELQVVVTSRHNDPRVGETVYQLTGINRGEPDSSLFQVPADFKLTEIKPGDVLRQKLVRPETAKP